MKLATYLDQEKITHKAFADRIGCEQPTVTRFVGEKRVPTPELMSKIVEATGGQVTPNDFYGIAA